MKRSDYAAVRAWLPTLSLVTSAGKYRGDHTVINPKAVGGYTLERAQNFQV